MNPKSLFQHQGQSITGLNAHSSSLINKILNVLKFLLRFYAIIYDVGFLNTSYVSDIV